jgi:hypothetical protein
MAKVKEKTYTVTETTLYNICKSMLEASEKRLASAAARIATDSVISHFKQIGVLDSFGRKKRD